MDHTRCVASLTFSLSLLLVPSPLCVRSFRSLLSLLSLAGFQPLSARRPTLTSILLSVSLYVALFPPFRRLPRPIANRFSFGSTIVRPRLARRVKRGAGREGGRGKKDERAEGRIKYYILLFTRRGIFWLATSFVRELQGSVKVCGYRKYSPYLCMFLFFNFPSVLLLGFILGPWLEISRTLGCN